MVKFHGDFNTPDQMVLSESQYMDRMRLENPMDFKLRADILGRAVLFIGYSFRDPKCELHLSHRELVVFRLAGLCLGTESIHYPALSRPNSSDVCSMPAIFDVRYSIGARDIPKDTAAILQEMRR